MSSPAAKTFIQQLKQADDRALAATARALRGALPAEEDLANYSATLAAAMSAAALGAWQKSCATGSRAPIQQTKREIDGAATSAAERVFSTADFDIQVAAGEGQRDDSPGAAVGQHLGSRARGSAARARLDGIFDYVDGTALAASLAPGALALGGLGHGLRPVPDLQAYAALVPASLGQELNIMTAPEDHALEILGRVASYGGKRVDELTVFTHSLSSTLLHHDLIGLLRSRAGSVIVPEGTTIEAPYLITLTGLAGPRIDCMIGATGLSELAFGSLLLDLICPGYCFVFRLASVAGPRKSPREKTLRPLFEFSQPELGEYRRSGLDPGAQYLSTSLVRPGSAVCAAVFAVTDNPVLRLAGPAQVTGGVRTQGLVFTPGGGIIEVTLTYRHAAP